MTITDTVAPLPPYVPPYYPVSNITPFTYRDGLTYLQLLEGLRRYINGTIIPFINDNFAELANEFVTQVNTMIDTVNTSLANQSAEVEADLAAQSAQVATDIVNLTTFVNNTVTDMIAGGINTTDPVLHGVLANPASASRILTDSLYVNEADLTVPTSPNRVTLDGLYERHFQTNAANFDTLQHAIDGTATGGSLFIPNDRTWTLTAALNVTRAMRIYGDQSLVVQSGLNLAAFNVTVSGAKIENLHIKGNQSASVGSANECAVLFAGTDTNNRVIGASVTNCVIELFGYAGIQATFVDKFNFSNNEIFNMGYAGILTSSASHGKAKDNYIHDIVMGTGVTNAYGIALSHLGTTPLAVNPQSHDILVYGNTIENIPGWEGIDTHGGYNITVQGNIINNCKVAIAMVPGKDSGTQNVAPRNINIIGNTCASGRSDGVVTVGIQLIGTSTGVGLNTAFATGAIVGNILNQFGTDSTAGCAIDLQDTNGVTVSGNIINEPAGAGIKLDYNNFGASVQGNTITDVWAVAAATCYGINMPSGYNYATIGGNTIITRSKVATKINDRGLSVGSTINAGVNLLHNDFSACAFPIIDTGNNTQAGSLAKKFGAYGVAPVVRAPAPATPTDLPTSITAITSLKTSLQALGLLS